MIDLEKIKADFSLNSFHVKNLDIKTYDVESGVEGQVHFNFDYNLKHHKNGDDWNGEVEFIVNSFAKHDDDTMFNISLIAVGKYSAKTDEVEEELFLNFLEHNGITMIIPLTRSFLQTTTSQWGIGPAILFPSINVIKLIEKHKSKKNIKDI